MSAAARFEGTARGSKLSRREALKLGAAVAAGASAARVVTASPAGASALNVHVDIPGAPSASQHVRDVALGTMTMQLPSERAATPAARGQLEAAKVDWGTTTIVFAMPTGAPNRELQAWVEQARAGKCAPRDVTVVVSSDSSKAAYSLRGAVPVEYGKGTDAKAGQLTEYLSLRPARVEMK